MLYIMSLFLSKNYFLYSVVDIVVSVEVCVCVWIQTAVEALAVTL